MDKAFGLQMVFFLEQYIVQAAQRTGSGADAVVQVIGAAADVQRRSGVRMERMVSP